MKTKLAQLGIFFAGLFAISSDLAHADDFEVANLTVTGAFTACTSSQSGTHCQSESGGSTTLKIRLDSTTALPNGVMIHRGRFHQSMTVHGQLLNTDFEVSKTEEQITNKSWYEVRLIATAGENEGLQSSASAVAKNFSELSRVTLTTPILLGTQERVIGSFGFWPATGTDTAN